MFGISGKHEVAKADGCNFSTTPKQLPPSRPPAPLPACGRLHPVVEGLQVDSGDVQGRASACELERPLLGCRFLREPAIIQDGI